MPSGIDTERVYARAFHSQTAENQNKENILKAAKERKDVFHTVNKKTNNG